MFSIIDSHLINFFQWIVRQLELFTLITRKEVININLLLIKWLNIIWATLLVVFSLIFPEFNLLFFVLVCFPFHFIYSLIKETHEKQVQGNFLPKETLSRIGTRRFGLFVLVFFSAWSAWHNWSIEVNVMVAPFVCAFYFFLLCVEYLLCTKSLPPGEKEKKKVEREMKNTKPQLI